ncbi:Asp-tRNA(Asn)/Glu-tRNA(Gln) amidotransferase subunit GatB [Lacibacter luteus]|uniref:Aspartyl/glutamyl-tRNA(Asn/Gln) amidotransferase subunit B n=1 Tax=Lacibacter luteus TaxID=2508719 RepID=A0A4Q1CHU5_9BACT|nr:Asp-tRNA(Asn)/Glu-tRNA(Gln) amidotransferase subunit GatB [Lacibacter luteus]RXK59850.1 Asp-tRNA(Asn)/Glu-tRNA(Gln) amidotransferase subunit GatB [Lacibacter luteus]
MSNYSEKYEAVVGLEVHAQLLTKSKLFCGDDASFGALPNTHVSPIVLAHPGTLPKLNKDAIALAVRMGLACNCEIERKNYFARKHYFYPDLPKGYQLSQHTTPVCIGGFVKIKTTEGERNVQLNRIHMEEDAGKSMHDQDDVYSVVDYNRAGVPLIEIVSEPDLHSGDEAAAYLTEVRKLVRTLNVCDGNMEEGSLRCDANISIRLKGDPKLGTKVEIKNLNSIRFLKKAIDHEVMRMIDMKEKGETILQQTRGFNPDTETTFAIRTKEDADDYRYMADPDLPPFIISEEFIANIRASLPELSEQKKERFMQQYALPAYDAGLLSEDMELAAYFEEAARSSTQYKQIANWLLGPVKSVLNEEGKELATLPLTPAQLVSILQIVEEGKVSHTMAVQKLFPAMLQLNNGSPAEQLAQELNLLQERNEDALQQLIEEVLNSMPQKVTEYKKGKKGLLGLFVGEVMKKSKGKADPKLLNQLVTEKLAN